MPELYGKPRKSKLYKDVRDLGLKLWDERKAHLRTRGDLKYAYCKIAELENTVERLQQQARALLGEASQNIDDNVWRRFVGPRLAKRGTA
jgi:hypothetical protein